MDSMLLVCNSFSLYFVSWSACEKLDPISPLVSSFFHKTSGVILSLLII